ncbi:MAG: hypothetical protein HOI01_11045 [Proteobacteria bacterium]|nr:hypothetical protein [Pseudomonadota bacterium]MBT6194074.1 hypothetical protein [Pseudomonadota bacterium]MBT6674905.1 hypothetical protein [Pseudomonadota bacterium]MBT7245884.1 hypothetical protein [Pseudomonadota bacterium]
MSSLYSHSVVPVRPDLEAVHGTAMSSFSDTGTWFNGSERKEIVALARRVRHREGLELTGFVDEVTDIPLPSAVIELIQRVACDAEKIGKDFYEKIISEGLSVEQYVEVVGLVGRAVAIDTFCRALGFPMNALDAPRPGEPSSMRPKTATVQHAWVPTIPTGKQGGTDAAALYGDADFVANIFSALSLVPKEASLVMQMGQVQYVGADDFMNFEFRRSEQFSRAQLELVAARISALNNCFY